MLPADRSENATFCCVVGLDGVNVKSAAIPEDTETARDAKDCPPDPLAVSWIVYVPGAP